MAIKRKYYNRTNTCARCGKNFDDTGSPLRECDEKGDWTGRWDCPNCWSRYDPNSRDNIRKRLADCRTGNFDPNSARAKGNICEELTCRWRGVNNLNVENNNYNSPIDHSKDHELGIIQTKGCALYYGVWVLGDLERDFNKEFDNMICYCISKDGKRIERIYIFPKSEIIKRRYIAIVKSPMNTRGTTSIIPWYEQFRIKDEDTLKIVNDIFKDIIGGT